MTLVRAEYGRAEVLPEGAAVDRLAIRSLLLPLFTLAMSIGLLLLGSLFADQRIVWLGGCGGVKCYPRYPYYPLEPSVVECAAFGVVVLLAVASSHFGRRAAMLALRRSEYAIRPTITKGLASLALLLNWLPLCFLLSLLIFILPYIGWVEPRRVIYR